MRVSRWNRVYLVGIGVLAACGGDSGGGMGPCTPGAATQFVKSAGDGQSWYFNNSLPVSYSATARDANNCPVPGVVVNWAPATAQDGSVDPAQSTTNANGVAMTTHTLGASAATQSVTATAATAGLPVLTFTSDAAAPQTTMGVSVSNNVFSPGSVVIQSGGTVTWTWNPGAVTHNVTYTSGPTPRPANSAPSLDAPATFSSTFSTVGTYGYTCTNHAGMSGTVRVVH